MRKIREILIWLLLLNKRILKKRSFIVILGCIPFLVIGVTTMSEQDSGIVRIALCQEDEEDKLATELIGKLLEKNSVVHFSQADSEEEAKKLVQNQSVDAAWIFHENFQQQISNYVQPYSEKIPLVTVVEREDNVALQMSREILVGILYEPYAYAMYSQYITDNLAEQGMVSEEELRGYYENNIIEDNLFALKYLDGESMSLETSYLMIPLKGFLALVILLSGLASAVFFLQDEEKGVFIWKPMHQKLLGSWSYLLIGMTDVGIVVMIVLKMCGSFEGWTAESVPMLLYLIMTAGFCDVLKRLCGNAIRMGAAIPIVILVTLAGTPIFIQSQQLGVLSYLLPTYYYLYALHNHTFVYGMMVYILVVGVIDYIISKNFTM